MTARTFRWLRLERIRHLHEPEALWDLLLR